MNLNKYFILKQQTMRLRTEEADLHRNDEDGAIRPFIFPATTFTAGRQHSDDEDTTTQNDEALEEFTPEVVTVRVPLRATNEHQTVVNANKRTVCQLQAPAARNSIVTTVNDAAQAETKQTLGTSKSRLFEGRRQTGARRQLGSPQITREMTVTQYVGAPSQQHQKKAAHHLYHAPTPPQSSINQQSPQQHNQAPPTTSKPSLKLLLAQQTAKPDSSARSPPIASNCQSQSSLSIISATHKTVTAGKGAGSPRSTISTNTNRQKAKNIQQSLGQLLLQTSSMFQKQSQHQANLSQKTLQVAQAARGMPKPRKSTTGYRNEVKKQHSGPLGQQPKVGKQLSDMLKKDGQPSMTGDIDDVANLVTPSPRRNPSKLNSERESICKMIKAEEDNNFDDRPDKFKSQNPAKLEHQDSFDHDQSLNELNQQEFNPLTFEKIIITDSRDPLFTETDKNNKVQMMHRSSSREIPRVRPLKDLTTQKSHINTKTNKMRQSGHHGSKQQNSSKISKQQQAHMHRQLPHQSYIDTKKVQSKHPNVKTQLSTTNLAVQSAAIAKPFQTKKQLGQKKVNPGKNTSHFPPSQSCDVIVESEDNLSNHDRIGDHPPGQPTNSMHKSALTVFSQNEQVGRQISDSLEVDLTKQSCLTSTNAKKLMKLMVLPPKQIEIELGFDSASDISMQKGASSCSKMGTTIKTAIPHKRSAKLAQASSMSQVLNFTTLQGKSSFNVSTKEIPLEE